MEYDTLNEYYDAHMHFNKSAADPVADFSACLERNRIACGVLIINNNSEWNLLQQALSRDSGYLKNLYLVCALNRHDSFFQKTLDTFRAHSLPIAVKLHPRLFQIKEEELPWYFRKLDDYHPEIIVVDDFLYGDTVRHGFTADLICALADRYPSTKIVAAHSGGACLLEHVMQTKVYKNVYYDISLTANYLVGSSVSMDLAWFMRFMHKRILIGSDYPDFELADTIRMVKTYAKQAELLPQSLQDMLTENIYMVFNKNKKE